FEQVIAEEHAHLLGWRDVPVNRDAIGVQARRTEPVIRQIFIARGTLTSSQFERKLYVIRKRAENVMRASMIEGREYFYVPRLSPIVYDRQSDSACLDNALEFLVAGGRSLPHAMMMLIPEPWVGNPQMDLDRRGFYEYHAAMMEPWDGPAAVCFTDGKLIGA